MPDEVVIVSGSNDTPASETGPAPEAVEAAADGATAVAEVAGETAVAVAEIEANRDVQIAETQAEVASEAVAAASVSDQHRTELEECRRNIESLRTELGTFQNQTLSTLEALAERLPPPSPSSEGSGEVTPDNQKAPTAPERKRRRLTLI